ncbi:MAG: N-acetyltransferase family protein [Flavobacteriales bacterium]
MQFKIRKAAPDDLVTIVKFCAEHAEYERADYEPSGKAEKLAVQLFSASPHLYCLLAIDHVGSPMGYVTCMREFSTWDAAYYMHMDCLFVQEHARGNGVGEALVNEVKLLAKQSECSHVQWQTPDWNERASKFYYRIGATSKAKLRMYLNL